LAVGTESSTIVHPRLPAGHAASAAALVEAGGFGVVAGAVGVVGAVVVVVAVGSGAVVVVARMLVAEVVATTVSLAELESSASQSAEATPATIATTSASIVGQIQSPGYQPMRRRHAAPRVAMGPVVAGSG
jgi:hypothetical protein